MLDDSIGFDEPAQPAQESKSALAITDDMGRIKSAVGEFDRVTAGLAELEAAYPKDVIYEVTTTKGMKAAIEHRAAWRDPRITVEKARKMAKAPLIALGKNIDARAAWLTEQLLEGETPIDQQIKAEEARREAEKEAKAAAEFGRVLAIQEALAEIAADVAAACGKASDDIAALLARLQSTQPDPAVFQEMLEQAKAAWAAGITKLETAHKAKLWEEAEARRIAAEQAAEEQRRAEEAARLKAEREEADRIAAAQRAEADRLAAERAEFERQRAEFAAQQQAAAEAKARAEAEERQRAETIRAEEARRTAELMEKDRQTRAAEADKQQEDAAPSVASAPEATDCAAKPIEQPTLTLGALNARLGFTVSADFLESLGFVAHREKSARLFRPSEFPAICAGISAHVLAVMTEKASA